VPGELGTKAIRKRGNEETRKLGNLQAGPRIEDEFASPRP
jgi:hypothetical protein